MLPYFITSSGTGIGKTLITTTLCWQLRQRGKSVRAVKPVISGYDPQDRHSDTALILESCGMELTDEHARAISPWRYAAPLSPHLAAAKEDRPIDMNALAKFCDEQAQQKEDILLVEGIGGAMVPLTEEYTVLDLMDAASWPVIVVAGTYLGSLSHTLCTLEVLDSRALLIHAIVVCESENSNVSLAETADSLKKFVPEHIPVVHIPRLPPTERMWQHMPSISWLCV